MDTARFIIVMSVPGIAVIAGIVYNVSGLNEFRVHFNARVDMLIEAFRAESRPVEEYLEER